MGSLKIISDTNRCRVLDVRLEWSMLQEVRERTSRSEVDTQNVRKSFADVQQAHYVEAWEAFKVFLYCFRSYNVINCCHLIAPKVGGSRKPDVGGAR